MFIVFFEENNLRYLKYTAGNFPANKERYNRAKINDEQCSCFTQIRIKTNTLNSQLLFLSFPLIKCIGIGSMS